MFSSAGCAKEVWLGSGGKNQEIALILLSLSDSDRPGAKINRDRFAELKVDIGMLSEDRSQTEGSLVCGKFGCRDLVQQRLELLIIVFVN